jgi:hypothetical protein
MFISRYRIAWLCLILFAPALSVGDSAVGEVAAGELVVGAFSQGVLDGWQEKSFAGKTQYAIVDTPGGKALRADSKAAASGLFKEITIDLERTPYLHWSWRVGSTFKGNDERSKSGDDYPARIYVVVSGGLLFWRTRAVNYVWSSHQAVGEVWPNAFTGSARMVAVRSGEGDAGRWVHERRNVREDLKRLFGEDISHIHAVAVMTDSDNTGQAATAEYGDIYFSAE